MHKVFFSGFLPWKRSADVTGSEGGVDGSIRVGGGFGENHGGDGEERQSEERKRRVRLRQKRLLYVFE